MKSLMSQDSVDNIVTRLQSFNSWEGSDFSLLQNGQTSSEAHPASYSASICGFCQG